MASTLIEKRLLAHRACLTQPHDGHHFLAPAFAGAPANNGIKYGRMLVSPFTFYRGSAVVMAADLAGTPVTGIEAVLCGDAHLSNFGVFATPERRMVFDVNDFDEAFRGPC